MLSLTMDVSRACLRCPCAEVLSESRVSRASDVYSFGMMMLELFTCKPLFPGLGHFQVPTCPGARLV